MSEMGYSIKYILDSLLVIVVVLAISLSSFVYNGSILVLNSSPKNSKTIIIDAGHGGEDCGAIGRNGVFEKDINLLISCHLANYLQIFGASVCLTRTEDRLLYNESENIRGQRKIFDLKNRLIIAENYDDAIFISIHMNSFPIEKYSGLQVWYQENIEESYLLAKNIQQTVKSNLQSDNNRKVKSSDKSMYLLDQSNHPAVLIECGFLSNTEECIKLSSETYQKELSFVIACAIIKTIRL